MPLPGYGVLAGVLRRHFRDQPDTQGRWFHVHLEVDAPAGRYACAIDVDSKHSSVGVQWRTPIVGASGLGPVTALAAGYHDLTRGPDSGALDYLRHPALTGGAGWRSGSYLDASPALESILQPGRRILVFGQPFTDGGPGMHNIHQNQGDPAGSQWWPDNAIWQDGGTAVERPDGDYDVFISKFSTQADHTDDAGHPG